MPVFRESQEYSLSQSFVTPIAYTNLYSALKNANINTEDSRQVTFGMVVLSGEDLASNGIFFQTGDLKEGLSDFLTSFDTYFRPLSSISDLSNEDITPYRFFFMISNSSQENISFCLASEEALSTQQYYLKSQ